LFWLSFWLNWFLKAINYYNCADSFLFLWMNWLFFYIFILLLLLLLLYYNLILESSNYIFLNYHYYNRKDDRNIIMMFVLVISFILVHLIWIYIMDWLVTFTLTAQRSRFELIQRLQLILNIRLNMAMTVAYNTLCRQTSMELLCWKRNKQAFLMVGTSSS